jgi:AcrR family transcriptional regulator
VTKQERAERTRRELIRSAAEAFDKHGYLQARMADISAAAGVSSGALHFHFTNKAALAHAVETEAALMLRTAARRARQGSDNPVEVLIATCFALAELFRGNATVRSGFQLSCQLVAGPHLNLRQEWQGCVQQLVAEAAADGLIDPEVPQQAVCNGIVAVSTGLQVLGQENEEWLSKDTVASLLRILLPQPRSTPARTW